eukprot:15367204-Ditylum_brightwellii.AAC.2
MHDVITSKYLTPTTTKCRPDTATKDLKDENGDWFFVDLYDVLVRKEQWGQICYEDFITVGTLVGRHFYLTEIGLPNAEQDEETPITFQISTMITMVKPHLMRHQAHHSNGRKKKINTSGA